MLLLFGAYAADEKVEVAMFLLLAPCGIDVLQMIQNVALTQFLNFSFTYYILFLCFVSCAVDERLETRLALIAGTSACHMVKNLNSAFLALTSVLQALSRDGKFVPGVWGPYEDAVLPGLHLSEGGQVFKKDGG